MPPNLSSFTSLESAYVFITGLLNFSFTSSHSFSISLGIEITLDSPLISKT